MCGIAGIFSKRIVREQNAIKEKCIRMSEQLVHRGPDDYGYYDDNDVVLSHRRLSIIDLSENAKQPMSNENDNIWIVFNGEFYNYEMFIGELKQKGHIFKSSSDTEVILHLYEEYGLEKTLEKINGMFAFALWDKRIKKLFIVRDRLGIKPLYFINGTDYFYFASEIKAFFPITDIKLDLYELWDRLVFGSNIVGKTIYKDIFELKPGHYITIDREKVNITEYYSLRESFIEKKEKKINYEYLESLLHDSIKIRLIADVQVGTLNSGGLDSSLLSSMAKKYVSPPLYTFSVAPEKRNGNILPGDESFFAELLAEHIGSKHKTIRYSQEEVINNVSRYIYQNDDILFHSNAIPLSIMLKEIKHAHNVTVLLSGEGADEIFRGYYINKYIDLYLKFKKTRLIKDKLSEKFPLWFKKYLDNVVFPVYLVMGRSLFLHPDIVNSVLGIKGEISNERLEFIQRNKVLDEVDQAILYEQSSYLIGLLQRVDRMSMMWGVEVRVPFLDHRLVEEVNKIEFKKKYNLLAGKEKRILKKIARRYLPAEIIKRRKYGFSTPLNSYKVNIRNLLEKEQRFQKILKENTLDYGELFLLLNTQLLLKGYA